MKVAFLNCTDELNPRKFEIAIEALKGTNKQ